MDFDKLIRLTVLAYNNLAELRIEIERNTDHWPLKKQIDKVCTSIQMLLALLNSYGRDADAGKEVKMGKDL